jgi:hypothetical protein
MTSSCFSGSTPDIGRIGFLLFDECDTDLVDYRYLILINEPNRGCVMFDLTIPAWNIRKAAASGLDFKPMLI